MGCALACPTSYPNLETMGVSPGSAVCPMCSLRPRTPISRAGGREGGKLQTKPENRPRESPGRVYIKVPSKMGTLKSRVRTSDGYGRSSLLLGPWPCLSQLRMRQMKNSS